LLVLIGGLYLFFRPVQPLDEQSTYLADRKYVWSLVNAEEFDEKLFKNFLLKQADFKPVDWPREFWYSVNFADPRGNIVIYQDVMMALAMGVKRLYQQEEPTFIVDNAVVNILSKRSYVWHDRVATNHFAREYAALAALAKVVGDTRFEMYQRKLHKSLAKLFADDGTPLEGPAYGLYTVRLLAPYTYLTGDQEVKKIIDKFRLWLIKVADSEGIVPPLEDSAVVKLPRPLSDFKTVNDYFTDWQFNFLSEPFTITDNLTIIRRPQYSLWLRHRQFTDPLNLHQHFSALDILLKSKKYWWLVASGYPGWQGKFDRPFLHNIATRQLWLSNNYFWRLSLWSGRRKTTIRRINNNSYLLVRGSIERLVQADNNEVKVTDKDARPFTVVWNINGELIEKKEAGNIYVFVWQQGEEKLKQEIRGAKKVKILKGRHALQKEKIKPHSIIWLTGSKIITKFTLESR